MSKKTFTQWLKGKTPFTVVLSYLLIIPGIILPWCEKMNYEPFYEALREIEFPGFFNMEISSTVLPKGCGEAYLTIAAAVARQMADKV